MIKYCKLILIIAALAACNLSSESNQASQTKNEIASTPVYESDTLPNGSIRYRPNYTILNRDTSSIILDFFDTIPETISDSGEFYTYDTTKLTSNSYVFLTNLVEFAIIKIKGKDIYLAKEHEKCSVLDENTFKDVFSGNGYTITFIHNKIENNNGATYERGTLEIENVKNKVTIEIHGGYKI